MPKVITITREFGSGGRELGRRIADELGIAYYDKEVLIQFLENTPYSQEYIRQITEGRAVPLFPIHYAYSWAALDPNFSQSVDVFSQFSKVLHDLASKTDCVVVGRCADYILEDLHPFKIFVYSDMATKVARCRKFEPNVDQMSDSRMIRMIRKVQKGRRQYYEFYTGREWGNKYNNDLLVNTSGADIKKLAHFISSALKD